MKYLFVVLLSLSKGPSVQADLTLSLQIKQAQNSWFSCINLSTSKSLISIVFIFKTTYFIGKFSNGALTQITASLSSLLLPPPSSSQWMGLSRRCLLDGPFMQQCSPHANWKGDFLSKYNEDLYIQIGVCVLILTGQWYLKHRRKKKAAFSSKWL